MPNSSLTTAGVNNRIGCIKSHHESCVTDYHISHLLTLRLPTSTPALSRVQMESPPGYHCPPEISIAQNRTHWFPRSLWELFHWDHQENTTSQEPQAILPRPTATSEPTITSHRPPLKEKNWITFHLISADTFHSPLGRDRYRHRKGNDISALINPHHGLKAARECRQEAASLAATPRKKLKKENRIKSAARGKRHQSPP